MVINVNTPNKGPFPPTHKVATEATHLIHCSSNLLNDTQQSVLPSPQLGLKLKTLSESVWNYPQVCALINGKKSLSASTLPERAKTLCTEFLQERKKTPCIQLLQEMEKISCVQSLQEREKMPFVQSQSVFIPHQCFQISTQQN